MIRLPRLTVRWRLALISAGLTFVILLLFAVVVGVFTARQVYSSFNNDIRLGAASLPAQVARMPATDDLHPNFSFLNPLERAAAAGDAVVRIVNERGQPTDGLAGPDLGPPTEGLNDTNGFRVASVPFSVPDLLTGQPVVFYVEYGKPLASVHHTIARMRAFLIFGVLAGTLLALLAGLALAQRAMAPIASLTRAAKEIARTRNPAVTLPEPAADDEVADLSRTLSEMLVALDAARGETEHALDRQRQFVADASHELRTPLTSILANLELLEAELHGEDQEIAGSALRSSKRMRRLVGDLLLLARADAGRPVQRQRVDLATVVRDAAAEAMPMVDRHELSLDIEETPGALALDGSADELHRLALNLIQNALTHTPAGTAIRVSARRANDAVVLTVSDDGPGIPAELEGRIFDRFVRGDGERAGRGSGLGLAIVRAVAESHGGSVELSRSETGGARFVARLPALPLEARAPKAPAPA